MDHTFVYFLNMYYPAFQRLIKYKKGMFIVSKANDYGFVLCPEKRPKVFKIIQLT